MRVVPPLDEFEHGPESFFLRAETVTIQQLTFQGGKETLAEGIVIAVCDGSHRRADAYFPAALAEGDRGVLAPLIGVVDHPRRTPLLDGHSQGIQNQFGAQMGGHSPAHHPTAPGIDNNPVQVAM